MKVSTNFTVQFFQNLYICNYMYIPLRVNVMIKASPYIQRQCVLSMNTCTFEQNRGSMPTIKGLLKLVSEYDQEIPQSQTADNPMAPRGRATQASATRDRTITELQICHESRRRLLRTSLRDYQRPVVTVICKNAFYGCL